MFKFLPAVLFFVAFTVFADTYNASVSWTDPTVYNAQDTPKYRFQWRVTATGTATTADNLTTPAGSFVATATPGQTIEVRAQNVNGALSSAWTAWVAGTAPHPATTPATPTNFTITISRQ